MGAKKGGDRGRRPWEATMGGVSSFGVSLDSTKNFSQPAITSTASWF